MTARRAVGTLVAAAVWACVAADYDKHQACRQVCNNECRDDPDLPPDASLGEVLELRQCRTICKMLCLRDHNFWTSTSGMFELKSEEGVGQEYLNACNLLRCFNYTRCSSSRFGIYIYPPPERPPVEMTNEYRTVLEAIRTSPYHVTNPSDACVLVPGFDTLCLFNVCHQHSEIATRISHALRELEYWDGGRNHVVFDYSDFLSRYDVGLATLFKTSMPQRAYRYGFDVVLPLYSQFHVPEGPVAGTGAPLANGNLATQAPVLGSKEDQERAARRTTATSTATATAAGDGDGKEGGGGVKSVALVAPPLPPTEQTEADQFLGLEDAAAIPPVSRRKYLLTFKGSRYSNFGRIRNQLRALDNGKDVIIRTKCFLGLSYDDDCEPDMQAYNEYDYADLLLHSKFGLVVPGVGEHSYRLLEVMQAGGIPVIINDDCILPLEGLVNWDSFSIRVPESQLGHVVSYLRRLDDSAVAALQSRALHAFRTYFPNTTTYIQWAFELQKSRLWMYADR